MNRFNLTFSGIATLCIDFVLINLSLYLSYSLRFDFQIPEHFFIPYSNILPMVVLIKLSIFYTMGLYRGMWRYTGLADVSAILKASTLGSLLIITMVALFNRFQGFPRSVFLVDWGFTILLISGYRLGIRFWFEKHSSIQPDKGTLLTLIQRLFYSQSSAQSRRLIIIGAGDCGEQIVREILGNNHLGYNVIGFIDDNPKKHRLRIHGIPVLGGVDDLEKLARRWRADEYLIAIPSANGKQMRHIVEECKRSGIGYKTIPSYGELINGSVSVKEIRDVVYRDLLGRETINLEQDSIRAYVTGDHIMVTGAGGSIGSELCRQVAKFKPRRIILIERAESPLFDIEIELRTVHPDVEIVSVLGDVCDSNLVRHTMKKYRPCTIFHAAAYKHVPMLESQPWKAVDNNIVGTYRLAQAALAFDVDRFVFVSTDKAVRPANVMGVSKRVSERLLTCYANNASTSTKFMIVRFGNVVGSVGSVVPLFKKQIATGGPVTVTHSEATRYFMTIPEACQLILQAGAMGIGGETFILDMGTAINIDEMARDLIRLSGFEPEVEIPIEYIGLRPGEKLHEELNTKEENAQPTDHDKIMVIKNQACDHELLETQIEDLIEVSQDRNSTAIRDKLKAIISEYEPVNADSILDGNPLQASALFGGQRKC